MIGQWAENNMHGMGTYHFQDGSEMGGYWNMGQLEK
jgi:hypothetical protein